MPLSQCRCKQQQKYAISIRHTKAVKTRTLEIEGFGTQNQSRRVKRAPPSMTLSALSRHTSSVRVAKDSFSLTRVLALSFSNKARTVNPAVDYWFHQPSIDRK